MISCQVSRPKSVFRLETLWLKRRSDPRRKDHATPWQGDSVIISSKQFIYIYSVISYLLLCNKLPPKTWQLNLLFLLSSHMVSVGQVFGCSLAGWFSLMVSHEDAVEMSARDSCHLKFQLGLQYLLPR